MQDGMGGLEAVRFRISREASERLHTYAAYRQMQDRRVTLGVVLEELIALLPEPGCLRRDPPTAIAQALDEAIRTLEAQRATRQHELASDKRGTLSID